MLNTHEDVFSIRITTTKKYYATERVVVVGLVSTAKSCEHLKLNGLSKAFES